MDHSFRKSVPARIAPLTLRDDLVGDYFESGERGRAERSGDRDVGRIPPTRHEDPADPRNVVARVERIPAVAEINLHPRAEIHLAVHRHADIAEVTGAVARGYVHAAAERNRKMREVTADTLTLRVACPCRRRGPRVVVP